MRSEENMKGEKLNTLRKGARKTQVRLTQVTGNKSNHSEESQEKGETDHSTSRIKHTYKSTHAGQRRNEKYTRQVHFQSAPVINPKQATVTVKRFAHSVSFSVTHSHTLLLAQKALAHSHHSSTITG